MLTHAYTGLYLDGPGRWTPAGRWYDPTVGRLASIDPLLPNRAHPQQHNAYSYARNNPINAVDPNGTAPWDLPDDNWVKYTLEYGNAHSNRFNVFSRQIPNGPIYFTWETRYCECIGEYMIDSLVPVFDHAALDARAQLALADASQPQEGTGELFDGLAFVPSPMSPPPVGGFFFPAIVSAEKFAT